MTHMPEAAMVLAAGLGKRMRPLTDDRPKPLIEVAGKALIDHALDRFAAAGVSRAVVNVHYHAAQLEAHLAARTAPLISISDERGLLLETGGGLKKAAPMLGDAPFFCTNTDAILLDADGQEACARLTAAWNPAAMDALLLLTPIDAASGYQGAGDFHLHPDGTIRFRDGASAPFIFTGLQILSPNLLRDTPEGPFSTKVLWERAAASRRLHGLAHRGRWMHVGDPDGLRQAEAWLAAERKKA